MGKIPKSGTKARRRGAPGAVSTAAITVQGFAALASGWSGFANALGQMADKAAIAEGRKAGLEHGSTAALPGPSPVADPPAPETGKGGNQATALTALAGRLGVDPLDLATVISYETSGRFSPSIRGGKNNLHIGLIQFGEEEQKKYGAHQGQSFEEQLGAVERYLTDRGYKPGMGILDLYSTINAGTPGRYTASDRPGATVESHVQAMLNGDHRKNAQRFLASAVTVEAASEAPLQVLTSRPSGLELTGAFTLRGQAFDRAARSVYGDRTDIAIRESVDRLAETHGSNSEALAAAIDADIDGRVSAEDDPELQVQIKALGGRLKLAATRQADRAAEAERKDQAKAEFDRDYQARRTGLIRLAMNAGDDAEASAAIAGELEAASSFIESQGELSQQLRERFRAGLVEDVRVAQIEGGFTRRETPEAREAYQKAFETHWTDGKGVAGELSPEAFRRANGAMLQRIRHDRAEAERHIRETGRHADQLMTRLKAGYALPADELAAVKARVETSGDPRLAASFGALEQAAAWQAAMRQARPADIDAHISEMQAGMDKRGATPEGVEMVKVMQGLKGTIERGLKADPLALAERVGLGEVPPLDTSSAEALTVSMVSRAAYADMVSRRYQQEARYFRPGEATSFKTAIAENPSALISLSSSLAEAFGDRRQELAGALREISKEAPLIGHAAGVSHSTGELSVLQETATAVQRRGLPDYKPVTLDPAQQARYTRGELGAALRHMPGLESSAMQQAALLFEVRAHGRGIAPADNNAQTQELWRGALQDALGQHQVDGETRGGFAKVNTAMTLIPPEMSAESVQGMLDNLTASDLENLPPIVSANGLGIAVSRIRNGKLVAAGHGQYFVALGDVDSGSAKYLQGRDGKPWRLDLFTLAAIQQSRPDDFPAVHASTVGAAP